MVVAVSCQKVKLEKVVTHSTLPTYSQLLNQFPNHLEILDCEVVNEWAWSASWMVVCGLYTLKLGYPIEGILGPFFSRHEKLSN